MESIKKSLLLIVFLCLFSFPTVFARSADALEIVLEPSTKPIAVGDQVRVQIYADQAVDLISMGVKICSDNPTALQIASASKYEDFSYGWVMDADGLEATTDDRYTNPQVDITPSKDCATLIGGRLIGSSNSGLSGKVLLGWVVFEATASGRSTISVDRAKYNDTPGKTFDNFVQINGTVLDEQSNIPETLGTVCVFDEICRGDLTNDGFVTTADLLKIRSEWNRSDCNEPGQYCIGDITQDGLVTTADLLEMRREWGQTGCPVCN